jgi:hypothetical protein
MKKNRVYGGAAQPHHHIPTFFFGEMVFFNTLIIKDIYE